MTRRRREEISWGLAVAAAGLFCLVLLPLYPLAWLLDRIDEHFAKRGR